MNSMKYGFFSFKIYSRALLVASQHAKASLPSTLVLAIPIEIALGMIPSEAYWSSVGVEMAYLLFLQRKRVWHLRVAAKLRATAKSPSLAAPSPT
jgi:hypothetical protein